MRSPRPGAVGLSLLVAGALLVTAFPAAAQSCPAVAVWVDDGADNPLNPSSAADLIDLHIGSGASCDELLFGITVGPQLADAEVIAVDHMVDLLEPAGAPADYAFTFTFTIRELASGGVLVEPYVTFFVDGTATYDTQPNTATEAGPLTSVWDGDAVLDAFIPISEFGGILGFLGANATSDAFFSNDASGPVGQDTAATDQPYSFAGGVGVPLTPVVAGDPGDVDGDGLNDTWERDNFGDLNATADGDPDDDGLNNTAEFNAGTDPNKADTDGDGHDDGAEVANGTDPLDPDDPPAQGPSGNNTGSGNGSGGSGGSGSGSGSGSGGSGSSGSGGGSSSSGGEGDGKDVKNLDDAVDAIKDEQSYFMISVVGLLVVIILAIVALVGRWRV